MIIGNNKAYYEPSHGSAPDIAGKNIANPYSMIGSTVEFGDKMVEKLSAMPKVA
jgi:3-isopropylmalate dehydrogenase